LRDETFPPEKAGRSATVPAFNPTRIATLTKDMDYVIEHYGFGENFKLN
jgi:hypothetical protein